MSWINLLGVICTVVSKDYSRTLPRIDFRSMRKQMGITFLNDLPEFMHDEIKIDNGTASACTIVVRPLDILGGTTVEYHYGIVMGTSCDGRELILEMTKGRNVNLVTKEQFLSGFDITTLKILDRPNNITRDEVIERAKKYQFDLYSLLDLNCKDFALYCVYLIEPRQRSRDLLQSKISANEMAISYWELVLTSTADESLKKYAHKMLNEMRVNLNYLKLKITKNN